MTRESGKFGGGHTVFGNFRKIWQKVACCGERFDCHKLAREYFAVISPLPVAAAPFVREAVFVRGNKKNKDFYTGMREKFGFPKVFFNHLSGVFADG